MQQPYQCHCRIQVAKWTSIGWLLQVHLLSPNHWFASVDSQFCVWLVPWHIFTFFVLHGKGLRPWICYFPLALHQLLVIFKTLAAATIIRMTKQFSLYRIPLHLSALHRLKIVRTSEVRPSPEQTFII